MTRPKLTVLGVTFLLTRFELWRTRVRTGQARDPQNAQVFPPDRGKARHHGTEAEVQSRQRGLDRASKRANVQKVARLQIKVRRLDADAKVAQRRLTLSTHWMRHAFAKEVVRRNPNGAGLNYAQEALGHTSIATTGAS